MDKQNNYNDEKLSFFSETIDKVLTFFKKRLTTALMGFGAAFIITGVPGTWEFILVVIDRINGLNTAPPEFQKGPLVYFGVVLFFLGIGIRGVAAFRDFMESRKLNLKKRVSDFFKNYKDLECVDKEEEFSAIWKIETSCHVIDNVFARGHDLKTVTRTFVKGFSHLKPTKDWFVFESSLIPIKLRQHVASLFIIAMVLLMLYTALLIIVELFIPGSTNSGLPDGYGHIGYGVLLIAELLGIVTMFSDYQSLGCAITFVEKYHPDEDVFKEETT